MGPSSVGYYRWAWVGAVMVGSLVSLKMVFDFADVANALMALPDLLSLFALQGLVRAETRRYFQRSPQKPRLA